MAYKEHEVILLQNMYLLSSGKEGSKAVPYGAVKSPPDERDWKIEALQNSEGYLPPSLDLRSKLPAVRNQGPQGSCAAMTSAAIKEWQERAEWGYQGYMAPQYIYNLRENYPAPGMYARDTMKILQKRGVCTESTYPYGKALTPDSINEDAHQEAKNHVVQSYALVESVEGLKRALYLNGPCYISVPVYSGSEPALMWRGRINQTPSGGHAMTVVGYNREGFIIRNSWGPKWNGNGHCLFPYDDWGRHWEVWSLVDAKTGQKVEVSFWVKLWDWIRSLLS